MYQYNKVMVVLVDIMGKVLTLLAVEEVELDGTVDKVDGMDIDQVVLLVVNKDRVGMILIM
jgi:hypothetical protein